MGNAWPPLPTYPYLDQYVEDDVEVATVDEHVGEKSPDLLLLVRVEYEGSLNVGRAVRSHCLGGVSIGQDQHVVDEHTDLEVKNSSSHFFVLWYWIDVSPAMVKIWVSKEIFDGN